MTNKPAAIESAYDFACRVVGWMDADQIADEADAWGDAIRQHERIRAEAEMLQKLLDLIHSGDFADRFIGAGDVRSFMTDAHREAMEKKNGED